MKNDNKGKVIMIVDKDGFAKYGVIKDIISVGSERGYFVRLDDGMEIEIAESDRERYVIGNDK